MARKKTPSMTPADPIDALLDGKSPQKNNNAKPVKRRASKTEEHQDAKDAKRKVTLYLPDDMMFDIDMFVMQARRWTAETERTPSRSTFIEAAMFLALEDLNESREKSRMIQRVRQMLIERKAMTP